jgi:8-oxo-dGDP phosphatase
MSNWEKGSGANPAPWTVVEHELIHADKWIRLRSDTCVTSTGVSVAPYYVLEYPNWVHVVAIDENDHVVVIYQYRHAAGRICCELPCGCIEDFDSDPLEAAKRELLEETGYAPEHCAVFSELSPNPATHTNRVFGVLALGVRRVAEPRLDPTEIVQIAHLSVERVITMATRGQFYHSMHVSSLLLGLAAAGKISISSSK